MADNKQLMYAKSTYRTLCKTLDNMGWSYQRNDAEFKVTFSVNGDDISMNLLVIIDADRQLIRLLSLLPFKMNEDKLIDGAVATCAINFILSDGSFDFDISEGHIMFRMTNTFRDSIIGEELVKFMISVACFTVDKYNDKLSDLNYGTLSLDEFLEAINE